MQVLERLAAQHPPAWNNPGYNRLKHMNTSIFAVQNIHSLKTVVMELATAKSVGGIVMSAIGLAYELYAAFKGREDARERFARCCFDTRTYLPVIMCVYVRRLQWCTSLCACVGAGKLRQAGGLQQRAIPTGKRVL